MDFKRLALILILAFSTVIFAADDTVYVDGTLASGNNDGTSWANAYQGAAGLQTALDAVNDGNDTDMFIRNTFTLTGCIDVDAGGGDDGTNKWLKIIGCDPATGNPLTKGSYTALDADDGAYDVLAVGGTVENVRFKNISFQNTDENATNIGCDLTTSTVYNFAFENCKFSHVYDGLSTVGRAVCVVDCVFDNFARYGSYPRGIRGTIFIRCIFDCPAAKTSIYCTYPARAINCLFDGGNYGMVQTLYADVAAINCTFYNQTVACLATAGAEGSVIEFNNIFMPADHSADYGVYASSGSVVYSDYSCCYAVDGSAMDAGYAWPTGSKGDNSIEVNPLFVDAANSDFRLKSTSPCINTGKPMPYDSDDITTAGYCNMGCWGRISYLRVE